MKRSPLFAVVALGVLGLILTSCATSTPAPQIAAVPTTAQVTAAPATATVNAADAAWAQVVDAAKKEGTVTVYDPATFAGDIGVKTAAAFKEATGITFEAVSGTSPTLMARLEQEKRMGKMVADVTTLGPGTMILAKEEGMFVSLSSLPSLLDKNVWAIDPLAIDREGYILMWFASDYFPWMNTNLVKPGTEPRSYQDLLKPEWKGKIIAVDPALGTQVLTHFVPFIERKMLDWEYIRRLGQQDLVLLDSGPNASVALAQGRGAIALGVSYGSAINSVAAGGPLKALNLQEGVVGTGSSIAVIQDAPHPNAAKVFVNWMLSKEGQDTFGKAKAQPNMRKDVADYTPSAAVYDRSKRLDITAEEYQLISKDYTDKVIPDLWKK